jgi:uncharacterized protein GlcG (DUF336 family)
LHTSGTKGSDGITLKKMPSKLNCKVAQEIIAGAVAAGQRNGLKPVAICILDPAGHEIATARMDGVLPSAFPKFAKAKAMTAISFGCSSREYRDKYEKDKFGQLMFMSAHAGCAPFPGGIVLMDDESGNIIGAVGCSGASSDEDEFYAISGVRSSSVSGISTLPAEPVASLSGLV